MFTKRQVKKWRKMLCFFVFIYAFLFLLYHIVFSDDKETIRIGVITCCGRRAREKPGYATETVTLIKSVMISASIWNVTRDLEFFLFVDSLNAKNFILDKVNGYRTSLEDKVRMKLYFLNATKDIPSEIQKSRLGPSVCAYTRLFFPDLMPDVKRILYLDTDNVITGNIQRIWDTFVNETGSERMAGMVQNDEPHYQTYSFIFRDLFSIIPHVPPRGLNAGVMFMNLEEMRKQNWTTKALDVYRNYKPGGKYPNDQHVINILFNNTPDALKEFPCQFNFQHLHCDQVWNCQGASKDPDGVQIMHGAGESFHRSGSHFRLYHAYRNFDLRNHQNMTKLLVKRLKKYYASPYQGKSSCHGLLGDQLFKSLPI